jgi:hypothetical protein
MNWESTRWYLNTIAGGMQVAGTYHRLIMSRRAMYYLPLIKLGDRASALPEIWLDAFFKFRAGKTGEV